MQHMIWGILSLTLGLFLLLAALLLVKDMAGRDLVYGALFVAYGIYRLYKYSVERTPSPAPKPNPEQQSGE